MKKCLFLLTILLLASRAKAQSIRVEAARFERQLAFPYSNNNMHLDANVILSGPAFRTLSGYGHWQISEARDDQGTDLRPTDKWDLKENSEFEGFQAADYTGVFRETTTFALALSSPTAKKATLVRGTVSVVLGGKHQTVSVPTLTQHFGERLSSPILDAAGVEITMGARDKDHPQLFTLEVHGNIAALECDDNSNSDRGKFIDGIGVTDAKGRDVLTQISMPVRSDSKQRSLSVFVKNPLDDGMTLHLRVLMGSQTEAIPFVLRDVPLPSIEQMKLDDALLKTANDGGGEIRSLVAQGADVNARDKDGLTALYPLARQGDLETTRFLLQKGANPNLVAYTTGVTPLNMALKSVRSDPQKRYRDVALLLIKHGANVNAHESSGDNPLFQGAITQDITVLRTLLNKGAQPNFQKDDGYTALMAATQFSWKAGMKTLLDAGADPNLRMTGAYKGAPALTMAVEVVDVNTPDLVTLLLARKADPNIADRNGATTLFWLARTHDANFEAEYARIARLLIAHGANVNAQGKNGDTALKLAKSKGNNTLVRLLKAAGAKS